MDNQALESARAAYNAGDFLTAVAQLDLAKEPGEVSGTVDHLLGNAYMRLGQYDAAARAYASAMRDTAYGKRGALSCNQGRALLAAGQVEDAIVALHIATQDDQYATPYKAQMALGSAYEKLHDFKNAGIAYRSAAVDVENPQPTSALSKLGMCFMKMARPADAVEAYRTALDYTTPLESQDAIWADLGMAYMAANRIPEAVDAFTHATQNPNFELQADQQASFEAAKKALAAIQYKQGPSETDQLLAESGYAGIDPLDPTNASGELMPSPDDTGFWDFQEVQAIEEEAAGKKIRRKGRHTGLKAFLFVILIALITASACLVLYWQGFGYPSQDSVVSELFSLRSTSGDMSTVLSSSATVTNEELRTLLPQYASVTVNGLDRSMTQSKVHVTATLSGGGTQDFEVDLVRDGIGWKVVNVQATYVSQSSN